MILHSSRCPDINSSIHKTKKQNVTIFPNGHLVSRISDYIIYSVEAGVIDKVVEMYGPCMYFKLQRLACLLRPYICIMNLKCACLTCGKSHTKATKVGAIVGGQTSCKAPELAAFDKHLPKDVEIVSCHSLHGPQVNPKGQPLVRCCLPACLPVCYLLGAYYMPPETRNRTGQCMNDNITPVCLFLCLGLDPAPCLR